MLATLHDPQGVAPGVQPMDDLPVSATDPPPKRMRLRYAGTCRGCRAALPAGEMAIYHRDAKQVECLSCGAATAEA